MKLNQVLRFTAVSFILGTLIIAADPALAGTSGPAMPWDGPLTTIRDSLSGTIAHILITIAIVIAGLTFAFGQHGSAMRTVGGIALGGAIALGAVSLMTSLGWAGALV